jgi:biopolymer transport protein ExbD
MRFEQARARNEDERILPLINVVFLLLIFVMLTGTIAATDPFAIDPPTSASEGPAAAQDMLVQIGADGRLALDGQVMDEAALAAAVAERSAASEHRALRLKADGRSEAARVVALMERLQGAGVTRLTLLTVPEAR